MPFQLIGPLDVFFPTSGDLFNVTCGGNILLQVPSDVSGAGCGAGAAADTTPVPTLDAWGAMLLMFFILVLGIWFMRRRGFGASLSNR